MRDRATALAVVLPAALVGHELGDYVAQTNEQAKRKAHPDYNVTPDVPYWRTWLANQGHCATYHLTLAAKASGLRLSPRRAAAALAISWATHAVIDRRWPIEKVMEWTGSMDWYPAGAPHVDQSLHKGALFLAALVAVGGNTPEPV